VLDDGVREADVERTSGKGRSRPERTAVTRECLLEDRQVLRGDGRFGHG
jgi:hypothetical protein